MGIGPIEAIPAALRYAGLKHEDIDWYELNEAFAAQSLAVVRTLGLNPAKVNPMGGAIALGHPLGATGAIRAATVVHALRRHKLKYGMVTMCVGTGQGAAGIFEAVVTGYCAGHLRRWAVLAILTYLEYVLGAPLRPPSSPSRSLRP